MKFTIIVPTRNRPDELSRALASVFAQTFDDFEVVVVDDGSDPAHRDACCVIGRLYGPRLRLFHLPPVQGGHGPAYARNFGISRSAADYIGFLDDDDEWLDPDFLARVVRVLDSDRREVDLHLSDQVAYQGETLLDRVIWTEGLRLVVRGLPLTRAGAYEVGVPQLMQCGGFCHLNTTVVRRAFFWEIGGFDENIRYESDRDFYLRAIDVATFIKYSPVITARHNIPDPSDMKNVSTIISEYGRHIFQLRLLDKAIIFSQHNEVREYARRHKMYVLKHIAEDLWRSGDYETAVYYAQHVICAGFSVKWLLLYLRLLGGRAAGRLFPRQRTATIHAQTARTLYYRLDR